MQTATRKTEHIGNVVGGVLAGILGVIALDQVAGFFYSRESAETRQKENKARTLVGGDVLNPTTILMNKLSKRLRVPLSERQSNALDQVLHYGLGALPGAVYSVALAKDNRVGAGKGFFYGLGLFLLNDEILSVKLGLAAPPRAYPWQSHARGLISHIALGMVTHWGCRTYQKLSTRQIASRV